METWAAANEEQVRYQDGGESAHWLAYKERCERMLAPGMGVSPGAAVPAGCLACGHRHA